MVRDMKTSDREYPMAVGERPVVSSMADDAFENESGATRLRNLHQFKPVKGAAVA